VILQLITAPEKSEFQAQRQICARALAFNGEKRPGMMPYSKPKSK
jgi:hypothetical protein